MLTPSIMLPQQSSTLLAFWPGGRCLLLCLLIFLGSYGSVYAQETEKVRLSAEDLHGEIVNGERCTKLRGNVVLNLEEVTITADNALYYEERKLIEAEGNVKIVHQDGSVIVADRLIYEEETEQAQLRNNVIYKSDDMTFYTDHLDYNMKSKQGHFVNGGKLVEGNNVLTSQKGSYNDVDKAAKFEQQVKLVSQDYIVQCDTLRYNTVTKVARFKGKPAQIRSQDGKQHLETSDWGEYNAESGQSTFAQSKVEDDYYVLWGDLLSTDPTTEVSKVTGHVRLVIKEDNIIVSGDYGEFQKKQGIVKIHGNALMTKLLDDEKLYISADTFVATEEKSKEGISENTVKAFNNVKLYKEDLQGKADSMEYKEADSKIYLKGDPVFWNNNNQLTADDVYIVLQNKDLHELHMKKKVFLASEDELGNFNQLQGRDMVAHFKENKLSHIEIDGNAESIYFVLNDEKQLQGMNHLRCSHMRVNVEEDELASIAFNIKPKAKFYPPHLIPEELEKLEHFIWKPQERPAKQEVVGSGYGTLPGYEAFKLDSRSINREALKK